MNRPDIVNRSIVLKRCFVNVIIFEYTHC